MDFFVHINTNIIIIKKRKNRRAKYTTNCYVISTDKSIKYQTIDTICLL